MSRWPQLRRAHSERIASNWHVAHNAPGLATCRWRRSIDRPQYGFQFVDLCGDLGSLPAARTDTVVRIPAGDGDRTGVDFSYLAGFEAERDLSLQFSAGSCLPAPVAKHLGLAVVNVEHWMLQVSQRWY